MEYNFFELCKTLFQKKTIRETMIKNIFITENTNIHQAMQKLQKTGEKCLIVVSKQNKLLGTINDGDIRRAILNRISTSKSIKYI